MDQPTRKTFLTRLTLLAKVQDQRDDVAWQEFFRNYEKYIGAIIIRMGINEADKGDVMQEIFLKLWKVLPTIELEKVGRFRSLLGTIVRNCTYDHIRKQTGRRGNRKEQMEKYKLQFPDTSTPDINQIEEEEWNKYVFKEALERVSSVFSETAIEVFKTGLEGRNIQEAMEKHGLSRTTAYAMRARVKQQLIQEVRSINEYLG
jgi:RNA polymerase sigma-70 factor (ECF subfamily)